MKLFIVIYSPKVWNTLLGFTFIIVYTVERKQQAPLKIEFTNVALVLEQLLPVKLILEAFPWKHNYINSLAAFSAELDFSSESMLKIETGVSYELIIQQNIPTPHRKQPRC